MGLAAAAASREGDKEEPPDDDEGGRVVTLTFADCTLFVVVVEAFAPAFRRKKRPNDRGSCCCSVPGPFAPWFRLPFHNPANPPPPPPPPVDPAAPLPEPALPLPLP